MTGKHFLEERNKQLREDLAKEGLYTISSLQKRLNKEGFANTKISIYNLERQGKILPPSERRKIRGSEWRLYTKDRIDEIITQLKKLPQKRVIM